MRFDVLREGKDKFVPGEVIDVDLGGDVKRVKFHFLRMKTKFDEWVEIGTSRIKYMPASSWGSSERATIASTKAKARQQQLQQQRKKTQEEKEEVVTLAEEKPDICKPDDIITEVAIEYKGDYVLSQLLQWYNGGIGQKPGMPNSLGCATLPTMAGCISDSIEDDDEGDGKAAVTHYEEKVRPRLVDWFEDRNKRGNPWPKDIQSAFVRDTYSSDAKGEYFPLGSPVLDFLVSGDDANIREVIFALRQGKTDKTTNFGSPSAIPRKSSLERRLQSSVDEGMPEQAVANWVQCDRPECGKWRRLPWHVDVDALPDKFYCEDNIWNSNANTCDAPEDGWNEMSSPLVGVKAHEMDRGGRGESGGCITSINNDINKEVKEDTQKIDSARSTIGKSKSSFKEQGNNKKTVKHAASAINKVQQPICTIAKQPPASAATAAPLRGKVIRCGYCENCTRDMCGKCIYCLDKPKYGGPNKLKKGCIARRCLNSSEGRGRGGFGGDTKANSLPSNNNDFSSTLTSGGVDVDTKASLLPRNNNDFDSTQTKGGVAGNTKASSLPSSNSTLTSTRRNIDKDALEAALGMLQHQKKAFISPSSAPFFSPRPPPGAFATATATSSMNASTNNANVMTGIRTNLSEHLNRTK